MTRAGMQSSIPALFCFEKLLNDFIYTEYIFNKYNRKIRLGAMKPKADFSL
jgi:hypothetical protein